MTPPIGRNDRDAQIRAAAIALGWKTAGGGFLYRVNDTYLFEMSLQWQNSSAPVGMIKTKPLALDPLFWEIVGLPALQKKRVSFRVNGVFTVPSLVAASVALTDEASPDEVVERLHGHFVDVEKRFQTLLDFEELIVANTDCDGTTRSTFMTWMLAAGRRTEAERLARVGLTSNNGGFLFSGGPVEDLVLDYLGFHPERGTHVALINGTRLSIFPGYALSPEQRLRGWLRLMDGQGWFAVALWKLPPDADRRVRDDRWEAGSYIQCAGGPDRFTVECRVDEVGGAKQVVLGDPRGDCETTVVVQRGEFTSTVFANEVFGPDEVIRLFLEHSDHGSIPGGVAMRLIEAVSGS